MEISGSNDAITLKMVFRIWNDDMFSSLNNGFKLFYFDF